MSELPVPESIDSIVGKLLDEKCFRDTLNKVKACMTEERGLPTEMVEYCMKLALQWALSEITLVRDCEVYIDSENWVCVLQMHLPREVAPEKIPWVRDPVYDTTVSLPGSVDFWAYQYPYLRRRWEQRFVYLMDCAEAQELLRRLRAKVHTVISGELLGWDGPDMIVAIKEGNLILEARVQKSEVVPREQEMGLYEEARRLSFYLLSVKRVNKGDWRDTGYGWTVNLSRASKNFPAALIRMYAPWIKAKGVKRIVGKKSWVRCDKYPGQEVLEQVSSDLMGEVVEVV